ncbi:MAG: XRE family transcriptional regulator [Planctomycetota bacterium]
MPRSKRPTQPTNPQEDALTRAVGVNLKRLRSERGWSMDQLAERSQVSKAMLHQIEAGKSVPTIAVVWRLADGLKVPFSDLLSQPHQSSDVVLRKATAKYLTNAEQTFSSRALFPFEGPARTAEFYELRLKPGCVEEAEAHTHGTMEHLALVNGGVTVEVDGVKHVLTPGDCLVFRADRPHAYRSTMAKDESLLFLMMTYALPGQIHA